MARKRTRVSPMNVPMYDCMDGCTCKMCADKKLSGTTGVESGLSSRESLGHVTAGTVKSHDLVEGEEFRSDKTGNDVGGVF